MNFRTPILLLLAILTSFFCWSLVCTWKKDQLVAKVRAEYPDVEDIETYLHNEYSEKEGGVWKLPLIGVISYAQISKKALKRGGDMAGSRVRTVGIDYSDFLAKACNANATDSIAQDIEKVKSLRKENSHKSFLAHFCEQVKVDTLIEYFNGKFGITAGYSRVKIKEALRKAANKKIDESLPVLERRLNPQGVTYDISRVDNAREAQISIGASVAKGDADVAKLIENPGELKFYEVVVEENKVKSYVNMVEKAMEEGSMIESNGVRPYCLAENKQAVEEASKQALAHNDVKVFFGKEASLENGSRISRIYFVKEETSRSNMKVEKAFTTSSPQGGHQLEVTLDKESGVEMGNLTERIINAGSGIAIVVDGEAVLVAKVEKKLQEQFSITGHSWESCEELGIKLKSGALPAKLVMVKEEMVSASLGEKAQKQGFQAILFALILVLLFMMLYYAMAGLLANVSLLFNVVFILGALAQFDTALTLPGIASIVLTIGMAIDSNVIIFEAIREELRRKVTIRQAIRNGYAKSYRSLIDSNVTTMLTGLILWYFGSGAIRGFATTLIVGLLASALTGVVLSRFLFDGFVALFGEERISFSFPFSKRLFSDFKVDFIGKRKFAYLFSLLFLGTGVGLAYHQGLDWGIDFTGGSSYNVRFHDEIDEEALKESIEERFAEEAANKQSLKPGKLTICALGNAQKEYKITTNFGEGREDVAVEDLLKEGISSSTGRNFVDSSYVEELDESDLVNELHEGDWTIDSSTKVEAVAAQDKLKKAQWAVLLALLMMLIYIFFSFSNFNLALSALIALVHDTLALFACFAFAKKLGWSYEFDLVLLSTVLTIIGYSINDTVVIFNGIRKEMGGNGSVLNRKVANSAINRTMSRTLMTSFTTLLPLCVLYLFGGLALESLSSSLFLGVLWGTYSSIFIATPLAHDIGLLRGKLWRKSKSKKGKKSS